MKAFIFLSFFCTFIRGQTPTPPNPQQFVITAGKPNGSPQIEVTTNYVDRLAGLFRIDVTNEGVLTEQAFYYADQKIGYDINYDDNSIECTKTKENYADMLAQWQKLPYAGKTRSISTPHIECNMWNQTDESYTWSYLASVKDNTPVEILDQSVLISVFRNYTIGPAVVPKEIFKLPVPETKCK